MMLLSIKEISCPKTDCPKKCVFLFIVVLSCSEHKTTKKVHRMKIQFLTVHFYFMNCFLSDNSDFEAQIMKKVMLFIAGFFLLTILNLHAQQILSKGSIGITYSGLGNNDAFYWESLDGAGGYTGKGYYSVGINYIHPVSSRWDIETGIEYEAYKYRFSNASLGPYAPEPYMLSNKLITIPATARLNFLRYFFINSGLLLDINFENNNNMDSQTGVGAMIGLGAKYDFNQIPIGVFLNSYYKHHTILT